MVIARILKKSDHVDILVQNYSNFSALAMELLLSCTKPSMLSQDLTLTMFSYHYENLVSNNDCSLQ